MISIGRFLGHDEKFYDLLEASAKQADSSVHHVVETSAKLERGDSILTEKKQTSNTEHRTSNTESPSLHSMFGVGRSVFGVCFHR